MMDIKKEKIWNSVDLKDLNIGDLDTKRKLQSLSFSIVIFISVQGNLLLIANDATVETDPILSKSAVFFLN